MKKSSGFTLMELIIVIIVAAILSAVAIPSFQDISTEARIASLNQLAGTLEAAGSITQGTWEAKGRPATVPKFVGDPNPIEVIPGTAASKQNVGWPTANGIIQAISLDRHSGGFQTPSTTGNSTTFDFEPAIANCNVVYSADSSAGTVNIAINTSGC